MVSWGADAELFKSTDVKLLRDPSSICEVVDMLEDFCANDNKP